MPGTDDPAKDSSVDNTWPLEADRLAQKNALIEALCLLAGHYGRRTSPPALIAGLPLSEQGVTPSVFIRAAERAGLHAHLVERDLKAVAQAPNLPCLLVLKNGQSCILWEGLKGKEEKHGKEKERDRQVTVQFPETADEKQSMAFKELADRYAGYAFFLRPVAQEDERAGPAGIDTEQDWFWGTLKQNARIYKDVVLAAIMINLFALASPLFVMNVYDRVIPNNAFATLWVLAAGVLTVFVFDFILKNLRARFLDVAGRRADVKISARLFEQIMGMTMTARPASAGVLASHMREFESLRDFFTSATMVALVDLPFVFLFIGLIAVTGG